MRRLAPALLILVCPAGATGQAARTELERAVEEFKIQTRNLGLRADSPAGKTAAQRPGREWHGRIYHNFRNDFLDAVPHEIVQRGGAKNILRRNQFGFNLAGLARRRSNTYVSLSYEGVRESVSRTSLRTVATTPERSGDFSDVVDQAGQLLPVFDPLSTRPNPAYNPAEPVSRDNLEHLRNPFPQNRIPAGRLDLVAMRATALYPQPNAAAGPFFRNNFFVNSPEINRANGMIGKLEHSLGERHRLGLELSFSNGFLGAARWFPTAANPGPTDRRFNTRRGSIEHVFTASSRTVNTATFEVSSDVSRSGNAGDTADVPASIGLAGVSAPTFPVFSFAPYLGMGRAWPLANNARNSFWWTNAISTRRQNHTLRLVAQHARHQVNTFWPQYPAGSLRFSEGLTSLPGIVNTGHAFASFLLGLADYAENSLVAAPSYFRNTYTRLALRDQYDPGRGLSVSLGLNIERVTPRVEKFDRQSTVDLAAMNPSRGRPGALVAAGRGGYGRAFRPATVRLEPSLSVAWSPRDNPSTVARLSYSRSYSPIPIYLGQWGIQGFGAYPTYISPNPQLEPALRLASGLPPLARPVPDLRPEAADDTVADLIDSSDRLPTYQSASLSLERQLPFAVALTVGASYSGAKNVLVGNSAASPNAVHPDYLSFRDRLNDEQFNRSLRPYPQYKGFDVYSSYPLGRYEREAGYVRLEKRTSAGLSLSAYYEFSKQRDDYSGPYGRQDHFNRANEWALTAGDEPHRLQLSYSYELPLGANKPFLALPDWRRHLADGWSLSGTAWLHSGSPISLRPQFNNTGGVVEALNVNTVAGVDPQVSDPGPELWFNPAAFDQPADFTLGNASRTHPSLRNPISQNYDLSLNKRIALAPDRSVEFSAAGFNFLNHANWNDPDNVIGPASAPNVNAGKIIGSRGGRVIQLGLRVSF